MKLISKRILERLIQLDDSNKMGLTTILELATSPFVSRHQNLRSNQKIQLQDIYFYGILNCYPNILDYKVDGGNHEIVDKNNFKVGDWYTFTDLTHNLTTRQVTELDSKLYLGDSLISDLVSFPMRPSTEEEIIKAKFPYERGELIFVKASAEEVWHIRYFSGRIEGDCVYCFVDQKMKGVSNTYKWECHAKSGIKELPKR